jgi:hypothetical protein
MAFQEPYASTRPVEDLVRPRLYEAFARLFKLPTGAAAMVGPDQLEPLVIDIVRELTARYREEAVELRAKLGMMTAEVEWHRTLAHQVFSDFGRRIGEIEALLAQYASEPGEGGESQNGG